MGKQEHAHRPSLGYSYANYTSKDTVRYEDVRANDGDSLGISNYAIPMQAIVVAGRLQPFQEHRHPANCTRLRLGRLQPLRRQLLVDIPEALHRDGALRALRR